MEHGGCKKACEQIHLWKKSPLVTAGLKYN